MSKIVDNIKHIPNLMRAKACTQEQVRAAETELGIKLPLEYVEFVTNFGSIAFNGHEWMGLNVIDRLDMVKTTKRVMSVDSEFPQGCFVLEDPAIDAQYILVDENGAVSLYQLGRLTPICESISAYIEKCLAE